MVVGSGADHKLTNDDSPFGIRLVSTTVGDRAAELRLLTPASGVHLDAQRTVALGCKAYDEKPKCA